MTQDKKIINYKLLLTVFVLFFILSLPVTAIEINPSVENRPFLCKYSFTRWICDMAKPGPVGAQGPPGLDGTDNFTAIFYNTTNVTSYANSTVFNNATNVTSNSNYTVVNGATFYNTTAINESYAYLLGRSGGQVLTGGVGANDDLILNGTSSATKTSSYVILQPNGGKVSIGNSSPTSIFEIVSQDIVLEPPTLKALSYATACTSAFSVNLYKYHGNLLNPSGILFSDRLGTINFVGYDGTTTGTGSIIRGLSSQDWSSSAHGSYLSFFTTPNASTTNTERVRIFENGNVTIGSSTLSSSQFNVAGSVRFANYGAGTATFDSGGNITSVSDEKYKTDIKPLTSGLNEVLKVNPICFKFNAASGLDTQNIYCGFSAQQLKTAIPSAVFEKEDVRYEQVLKKKGVAGEEDEYETVEVKTGTTTASVSDRAIIATLVNAIKELSAKNDALEKRIAALEKKVGL